MKLLAVRRLFRIQRVVIRYRLDDLLFALPLPWFLLAVRYVLPWRWFPRKQLALSRGARLRLDSTALARLAHLNGKIIPVDCTSPALHPFILPRYEVLMLSAHLPPDADFTPRAPAARLLPLPLSRYKPSILHGPSVLL